jgi:hypothetical protein
LNLLESGAREVEASSRGGNGPDMTRIDGLIALPVRWVFDLSTNVRWQWRLADAFTERMYVRRGESFPVLMKRKDDLFTLAAECVHSDRGLLVGGLE